MCRDIEMRGMIFRSKRPKLYSCRHNSRKGRAPYIASLYPRAYHYTSLCDRERACPHPPTLCYGPVHLLTPARHRHGSPRNGFRERGRALGSPQSARAVRVVVFFRWRAPCVILFRCSSPRPCPAWSRATKNKVTLFIIRDIMTHSLRRSA